MLEQERIDRFRDDGFLLGGQVLDDGEVDELRSELDRVLAEQSDGGRPQPVQVCNLSGDDDHPVWQVVNIWQASPAFRRLTTHPVITEEIAQLSGARELRIWHDQIQYKPAGEGGINPWHQDAPLWPILRPMTEVSAWVALDDVTEHNGCMRMVRGSHAWGDKMKSLQTISDFDAPFTQCEGNKVEVVSRPVPKGWVHYHHALTWHGSGTNCSADPRRAIALHFMTDETQYVASGQHVMKQFVEVSDGSKMAGDAFPLVYTRPASDQATSSEAR